MIRIIMLFLISLLTMTTSFSQTISITTENDTMICITPQQLKTANLIFLEHDKLNKENEVMQSQINALKFLYEDELRIDSLYENAITELNLTVEQCNKDIRKQEKLTKRAKRWTSVWQVIGWSSSLTLLLLCIL